jgi:ATP-dependent Clp protease adaptor protein ClpS
MRDSARTTGPRIGSTSEMTTTRWNFPEPCHPRPGGSRLGGDEDERRPSDGDADAGVQTKTKTKRPSLYKVLLLNDDYTPMEFVVYVLQRFFNKGQEPAVDIMLTVHNKGLAVVGVYPFEIAETKVTQVMDCARSNQHPLQCTMEKE